MKASVIDVDWETIVVQSGNTVAAIKVVGNHTTKVGDELLGQINGAGLATFLNRTTNLVLVTRVEGVEHVECREIMPASSTVRRKQPDGAPR